MLHSIMHIGGIALAGAFALTVLYVLIYWFGPDSKKRKGGGKQ